MLKVIIFCDMYNPQSAYCREQNSSTLGGNIDGRSWLEGHLD